MHPSSPEPEPGRLIVNGKRLVTSRVYCIARLPNTGLANRLFTWAQCVLYSQIHDIPRLAPKWWNLKIGPIFRGETDKRWYTGQFRAAPDEVIGLRRAAVLLTAPRRPGPTHLQSPPQPDWAGLIQFTGMADYFGQLNQHHATLRTALLNAVLPRWRRYGEDPPPAPIAIHIRRGDFTPAASMQELLTAGGIQTPINWFIDTLARVREHAGAEVPAFVMSDGTPKELHQILTIPRVQFAATGTAIGDLLTLSRSSLLIGSGGSSFSVWGAFLGQCPAVFPPGQDPKWFNFHNESGRYVGVFDPWQPDATVLNHLAATIAASSATPTCGG